jgi:hypothetical protein
MASIASIITDGFGAPGSPSLIITMGFGIGLQAGGFIAGAVTITPAIEGEAMLALAVLGTVRVRGDE